MSSLTTSKKERYGHQQHRNELYGVSSRKVRSWLKVVTAFGVALVLLNLLLSGSNISKEQGLLLKKALVVTAHPDDEVMFFAPSLLSLVSMGIQVHALCLSIGDADKLGHIRRQELFDSYATLGIPAHFVESIDDPRLPDGMTTEWGVETIIEHISRQIALHGPFEAIISFDKDGISSHPNHRACYQAIKQMSQDSVLSHSTSFYTLHTISVFIKFFSLPLAIMRQLIPTDSQHRLRFLSSLKGYICALRAMSSHSSQLVWFRYLYVMTSVYMYNNELIKL